MDSGGPGGYLAGMWNPTRTVLMLAMTLLVRTGMNAAEMPRALTWPEIENPAAVVGVAREIIAREVKEQPQLSNRFMVRVEEPRFTFPRVADVMVGNNQVLILLLDPPDFPFTGRGFLILADGVQTSPVGFAQIQDTGTPEIKRVLLKLPMEWSLPRCSVELRDFKQLDADKASGPLARSTSVPAFPSDFLRAGIGGKVEVEFDVTADGTVGKIETKGENEEFKREVGAALKQWRFIPGVDRASRVPVATRLAVTVVFTIHDD